MPQFEPHVFVPQIAWLILIFGLLFAVVSATLPKVASVTANRARVIGDDLSCAEAARASAATVHDAYEATLSEARGNAVKLAADAKYAVSAETAERLKAIDADLAASAAKAQAEIETARTAALANLRPVAEEATADIVERLTGRRPAAAEVAATVATVAA